MRMDGEPSSGEGEGIKGTATDKYRPSNVAPPPEDELMHKILGGRALAQETSGVAAAEATGKLRTDTEEDPKQTAGSG
jgi:hypothetical protein